MHFLLRDDLEIFYGGAAGGGKSDAILMGALMYVDVPQYAAILFRRSLQDHKLPEGLIPRSHLWLSETDAKWNGLENKWTFPSSATLTFGYCEHEIDKYRYQSAAFQYIAFDELTQFTETQYTYLFSRLRRLEGVDIPLRMRSASNPGGAGHDWVKMRFIDDGLAKGRRFIPARLEDNPYLDQVTYETSLSRLDYVTRQRLRFGDWEILDAGNKFKRAWFANKIVESAPLGPAVRYWDKAATEPKVGADPDYTVGLKMSLHDGQFYVHDVIRFRGTPRTNEETIKLTAQLDGRTTNIVMEQEPGSAGVNDISHYARSILVGYSFRGNKTTGDKVSRANPFSAACEHGNVFLVRGPWIKDFLDELCIFPIGGHDDEVDAASGAFESLVTIPSGPMSISFGRRPK